MNDRIYRVNELVTETDNLDLLDDVTRAYIAKKDELPFKVYVAGGDNYGKGLESYSKPHFHVIIENGSNVEKFKVLIPDDFSDKKLTIIGNFSDKKVIDTLIDWLDKDWQMRNHCSNLDKIKKQWSFLNSDNKYVIK